LLSNIPCWASHRKIGAAFGHTSDAIDAAVRNIGNYCWATEFENVHDGWLFKEPGFEAHGFKFAGPEQYYQLHKHHGAAGGAESFTEEFKRYLTDYGMASQEKVYRIGRVNGLRGDWEDVKRDVMREALQFKFKNQSLRDLLISTYPHQLVSVKNDYVWGIGLDGTGENALGKLLMKIREEIIRKEGVAKQSAPTAAAPTAAGPMFKLPNRSEMQAEADEEAAKVQRKRDLKEKARAEAAKEKADLAEQEKGTYKLVELQAGNPKHISAANKEYALKDDEFMETFGMKLDEFIKLPKWKRDTAKKEARIF
jgi:ribA/ribD-fused uncharacterized protein